MENKNCAILLLAGLMALAFQGCSADQLDCTETGMTFSYDNTTAWAFVNLLNLNDWASDAVQRFRTSSHGTISQCGTGAQDGDEYVLNMNYADCAGFAITIVQDGNTIKREAVVEIQPNANAMDPVLRHLNYTQYKLTCEYTRQINVSNTFNVTVVSTITKLDLDKQATFEIGMDLYETDQFLTKSPKPKQVTLNEPLYVELKKEHNDTDLKMVVEDCWATDTEEQTGQFKYSFLNEGCGLDATYETLKEDANVFQFKINAFVFIQLKSQTYLHCSLYVCEASSTVAQCQQGCSTKRRKRRAIEEVLSRERRATDTAPVELGRAVSSQIQYKQMPTCSLLKCPANSVCVENFPAFCRCNGNHVMDEQTKTCTDNKLVEMKVPTSLNWIDHYKDQSSDFLRIAKIYEEKMVNYFIKQHKIDGIKGVKISSAKNAAGSVEFQVVMSLAEQATLAKVSQQITDLLSFRSEEASERVQVVPSSTINILPVVTVGVPSTGDSAKQDTTTRDMILVAAGVLVILCFIFAIYRRRNDKKEKVQVVHLDGVKVDCKENKAYIQ